MIRFEFHIRIFRSHFGGLSAHCAIVYGDFTCGVLYFQAVPQYMAFCEHQRVYAYYWCLSGAYSCECYHS